MPVRVIVIGGGVIGVTTAAALGRRGARVTLLERARSIASGVSARNGGQLSYSFADALAAPSIVPRLPSLLAGMDPAFRICLRSGSIGWALRFLANCTAERFDDNTRAVLRLALRSRAALAELRRACADIGFDHSASGKLHIYDSAQKLAAAAAVMHIKNELGCQQRAIGVDELFAIEPALATTRRPIAGAIYSPIDETGDSQAFAQGLVAHAVREHGLFVSTDTAVTALRMEGRRVLAAVTQSGALEADLFVLAAGMESVALAKSAGVRLPILPMKGYSITLPATSDSPVAGITDSGARIAFGRLRDQVRVAGMAELGWLDTTIDPRRIDVLLQAAKACLPAGADWHADPKPWSGLRPMTPDGRPIIGGTPITNLFLNCGHGMLGWTLACGSAELAADLILDPQPTPGSQHMARDFGLTRFSPGLRREQSFARRTLVRKNN
jgi:D-amino-acid dehydrogenase